MGGQVLAPPVSSFTSRRRLNALRRVLHKRGWATRRRYEASPPLLLVFSAQAPHIGESVTVVRTPHEPWFLACSGVYLAPCADSEQAAEEVGLLLTPWVAAALGSSE
ncbi:hypothetical protein [Spirillospora sp. NPDC047279]|uniref:hypothetical protein n=1 Tax=Spirillospora sp. NPDC047279 TaxID=3155478 RepID=UPI0034090747